MGPSWDFQIFQGREQIAREIRAAGEAEGGALTSVRALGRAYSNSSPHPQIYVIAEQSRGFCCLLDDTESFSNSSIL